MKIDTIILTTLNQPLVVTNYISLESPAGVPQPMSTLGSIPLGTGDNTATGEIGVKVIVVGDRSQNSLQVTRNAFLVGASDTKTIPSGSRGWTVSFLTGTGTIDGVAVPAGFSDNDLLENADDIIITTNAASSAYVRWNS